VDLRQNFLDKEHFVANLKKVVHANYMYCLTGDDSAYRNLIREAGSGDENLEKFKEKFMPFFVEDFHWYPFSPAFLFYIFLIFLSALFKFIPYFKIFVFLVLFRFCAGQKKLWKMREVVGCHRILRKFPSLP
jgi:hypothetical protein